jgi:circadian clock protein KaiB
MSEPTGIPAGYERALERATTQKVELQLFVAGMGPKSTRAIHDLKRLCRDYGERCRVQIVDIYESPAAAADAQIFAVPALVRSSPLPRRKLIGAIGDTVKVARSLGLLLPGSEAKA